jgi:hypothetical protein
VPVARAGLDADFAGRQLRSFLSPKIKAGKVRGCLILKICPRPRIQHRKRGALFAEGKPSVPAILVL